MTRYLVAAAAVLGIVVTATRATALVSTIILHAASMQPFTWWHMQSVVSAAVTVAWTALVSYAAVQVCRRVAQVNASTTR